MYHKLKYKLFYLVSEKQQWIDGKLCSSKTKWIDKGTFIGYASIIKELNNLREEHKEKLWYRITLLRK